MDVIERLEEAIETIPDFPKKGVLFRDILPVLNDPMLCDAVLQEMSSRWEDKDIDAVAGIESRGFLFGVGLAGLLGVPFIQLRKLGKLTGVTHSHEYQLEYGTATLEIQKNALKEGQKILIHDDLLATGGTAAAAAELLLKADVKLAGFSFMVELEYFKASKKLKEYGVPVDVLLTL